MNYHAETNPQLLCSIGSKVHRERLNANLNQAELAQRMGVAIKTVQNLEAGRNPTLDTLISALRALGLLHHLDAFLPDPGISPIQLVIRSGKVRQRAGKPRSKDSNSGTWQW